MVLEHHRGISSLYTLTRGAAESAAIACYLTEPGIGSLERVRRNLNCDLQAMHEDLNMLRTIAGQDAIDKAARHSARIDAIGREGHQYQLQLTRSRKGYSAWLSGQKAAQRDDPHRQVRIPHVRSRRQISATPQQRRARATTRALPVPNTRPVSLPTPARLSPR